MIFHDLQICAWQHAPTEAQVMVLSSPVGRMRQPLTVAFDFAHFDEAARFFPQTEWYTSAGLPRKLRQLGRALSKVLLPNSLYEMVQESLKAIPPEDGLRIRLCLDERMADWPWEFMVWPDAKDAQDAKADEVYVALCQRVSLVREAPSFLREAPAPNEPEGEVERIVFSGTFWQNDAGEDDHWSVRREYIQLQQSLVHVQSFVTTEFFASTEIEMALNRPTGIFYYSGHVEPGDHGAYLVSQVQGQTPSPFPVQRLADLLTKAQTRLAFFGACNSARHEFADLLLQAGLPALIGSLGIVSNFSSPMFGSILFSSLVVGLSIDEAAAAARRTVWQTSWKPGPNYEWGSFVVYLPTNRVVLFPRAGSSDTVQEHQFAERLTNALATLFDLDELSTLCYDLRSGDPKFADLEFENLLGQTRLVKARELVQWCKRRSLLSQLGQRVHQERPQVELTDASS
jgi:hypothetical protein